MKDYTKLEKFIQRHYASLLAMANRFVDPDTAQDIVQNVIYRFIEKEVALEDIENIDNFLFTSVKNEALGYLRALRNENKRYEELAREEAEDPEVLHILIEEETNQMLLEAIETLPPQTAHIIRLVLSGYDNKEIAVLVNISINTVKTLKYGGIRKLREYFLRHKF
ncbi:MAG: sigma-70 family RNA polymerase sigma factor [Odoribacter sp.]|nr:sigma-70 family RNA polymerase sigma factor [Odoribacter sp.]